MTKHTCQTCTHWTNPIGQAPMMTGECHSNAPTVPANGEPGAVWPTTNHTDHCGAWKIASTKQREARDAMMGIEPTPRQSIRRSTMGRKVVRSRYVHGGT